MPTQEELLAQKAALEEEVRLSQSSLNDARQALAEVDAQLQPEVAPILERQKQAEQRQKELEATLATESSRADTLQEQVGALEGTVAQQNQVLADQQDQWDAERLALVEAQNRAEGEVLQLKEQLELAKAERDRLAAELEEVTAEGA